MEDEVFICECNSPEHQFIISYDGEYFYLTTFYILAARLTEITYF